MSEQTPVFDASVLIDMFGRESAIIASVLQTFVDSTRGSLAELAQTCADQNPEAVAALAHRISGASRMSGAYALGDAARVLEQAAKQGDTVKIERDRLALDLQWHILLSTISFQ
ncbi:MAG: Hpt domain-containing protein [Rhodoferax sp.]